MINQFRVNPKREAIGMKADVQLGSFSHAHCLNCKYLAEVNKFDWRKNVIVASEGMELIQLRLICPLCQDEHCEGLFPHEMN